MQFPDSIGAALADLRAGHMVVIVDGEPGRGEGKLAFPAQFADAETLNFFDTHGRGMVYLALTAERCDALALSSIAPRSSVGSRAREADVPPDLTVSIDAARGIGSGVSSQDRAQTVATAIDPASRPSDLSRPGHVLPIRSRPGGALERARATEAAIELAGWASLVPAVLLCPILTAAGSAARGLELERYCAVHGLRQVAATDVASFRRLQSLSVELAADTTLPTEFGTFRACGYRSLPDGGEHLALVKGVVSGGEDVHAEIHVRCMFGDVFGTPLCHCSERLRKALASIEADGTGIVVYLAPPEGSSPFDCLSTSEDWSSRAVRIAELPRESQLEATVSAILQDLGVDSVRIGWASERARQICPGLALQVSA